MALDVLEVVFVASPHHVVETVPEVLLVRAGVGGFVIGSVWGGVFVGCVFVGGGRCGEFGEVGLFAFVDSFEFGPEFVEVH